MFGFFSKKDETKKLLHGRDAQAENIPIHTMTRDLESIDHPEKKPVDEPLKDILQSAPKININSLTDQQKTSPFLNKTAMSEASSPSSSRPPSAVPPRPAETPPLRPSVPPAPQPSVTPVTKPFTPPAPQNPAAPKPGMDPAPKPVLNNPVKKEFFIHAQGTENDAEGTTPLSEGKGLKKLVLILIMVLIITFAFAGGYYFWNTRKNIPAPEPVAQEAPAAEQTNNAPDENTANTEEPTASKFSTSGPNYLEIDVNESVHQDIKEILKSYVQEVQASGINSAVEFKIVTPEKSPVSLPTFMEKIGMAFSPELVSALDTNYSFYIYNDQSSPGVGLAIAIKKDVNPEEVLIKEEGNLPRELEPLFPIAQYTLEKSKSFATAEYDSPSWGKIGVRYLNIVSPENLSVDYALANTGNERLLIGTTKMTLRAIIESQKPDIAAPQ